VRVVWQTGSYGESAYGELAHMANRLWQIGVWQKGIWRNDVVSKNLNSPLALLPQETIRLLIFPVTKCSSQVILLYISRQNLTLIYWEGKMMTGKLVAGKKVCNQNKRLLGWGLTSKQGLRSHPVAIITRSLTYLIGKIKNVLQY